MKKLFVSLLFFSFSVFAEDSYLEVERVSSKASARDSLAAKSIAFTGALNLAFEKMLRNYFPEVEPLVGETPEKDIQDCLHDYSIKQEKFSTNTYVGVFSFRFSRNAVEKMLRHRNLIDQEERKSGAELVAIYTQDYFNKYDQLKDYKVVVFSPKRMIFEIPAAELQSLMDAKVAFAKVNAKIPS